MGIKILKTEADYKEAIQTLEQMGDDPNFEKNSDLIQNFELLETLIGLYEKEHYPIEKGNPVEIIKLKMEYMGLKNKDLIKCIGSKGLVSDILNKRRKLSKKMIRELSKLLNISQEILNTEYELDIIKGDKLNQKATVNFHFSNIVWTNVCSYQKNVYSRKAILTICPHQK